MVTLHLQTNLMKSLFSILLLVPSLVLAQSVDLNNSQSAPQQIKSHYSRARPVAIVVPTETPGSVLRRSVSSLESVPPSLSAERGSHFINPKTLPSEVEEGGVTLAMITAGTSLNRAVANLAMAGGLGYVPSPNITETLLEPVSLPQGPALTMINTLLTPYGYNAIVQNNSVQIYGNGIDDKLAMDVLYYRFRYLHFSDIVDAPRTASSTGSSASGPGGAGSVGQQQGAQQQGQVLKADLAAKSVNEFFQKIKDVMLTPKGSVAWDSKNRTLIAKDNSPSLERLRQYLLALDKPVPTVYTQVRVLAVSYNPTNHTGIDWSGFTDSIDVIFGQTVDPATVTSTAGQVLSSIGAITMPGLNFPPRSSLSLGIRELSATLSLLHKYADVDQMQEHTVVSEDGMPVANFFGRQLFIVVPGTQASGAGTASAPTTREPEVGDTFTLLAETGEGDTVRLAFHLSSLKQDAAVNYGGILYPQFSKQSADEYITLRDGETAMLCGYMTDSITTDKTSLPGLGSIPFIGPRIFGDTKTSRTRTAIIFLLTPKILRPDDPEGMRAITQSTIHDYRQSASKANAYVWPEEKLRQGASGLSVGNPKKTPDPLTGDLPPSKRLQDISAPLAPAKVVPTGQLLPVKEVPIPGLPPSSAQISLLREEVKQ